MVAISNITENLKAFPTTHNVLSTFLRRSILRRNLLACHRSVLGFLMADRWQLVMQSEKKIRQCRSAGELDTPDMHSCRQSCFSALTEIPGCCGHAHKRIHSSPLRRALWINSIWLPPTKTHIQFSPIFEYDLHYFVYLVGVSPPRFGWRQTAKALRLALGGQDCQARLNLPCPQFRILPRKFLCLRAI